MFLASQGRSGLILRLERTFGLLVGAMLLGCASASFAEETVVPSRSGYVSLLLGSFDGPTDMGDFSRESGWRVDSGFFLAIGFGAELSRYVSLEYELVGWNGTYKRRGEGQPRSITVKSESYGSLVLKAALPIGPLRPYVGASAGLFESSLSSKDGPNDSKEDWGFGYQLLAGADFFLLRRHSLGVEFRRAFLRADFGKVTGGEQSFGGDILALAYRYWFR